MDVEGRRDSVHDLRLRALVSGRLTEEERHMPRDTVSILRGSVLFSSLNDDQIARVASIANERTFSAGARMISEGDDTALGMWIVVEGRVEVSSGGSTLATLGPGEHVGETALVSNSPRTADVTAVTETTTLQITRWDLRGLMAEHPTIAVGIMDAMAMRLANTNQALAR